MPLATPRISAWWLSVVAPRLARIGRELVESLRNDTGVRDEAARDVFAVRPRGVREAIRLALADAPIREIVNEAGWYYADRFWRLRGLIDRLAGGAGLRRGRRDPARLAVGDALDCWRVRRYEPDRLLRLEAKMRFPGRMWAAVRGRR